MWSDRSAIRIIQAQPRHNPRLTLPRRPAAASFRCSSGCLRTDPVKRSVGAQSGDPGTGTHGERTDFGDEDVQIGEQGRGTDRAEGPAPDRGTERRVVSDVHAREVIVYGKVRRGVRAEDRVEVTRGRLGHWQHYGRPGPDRGRGVPEGPDRDRDVADRVVAPRKNWKPSALARPRTKIHSLEPGCRTAGEACRGGAG